MKFVYFLFLSIFSYLSVFESQIPPTPEWFMFKQFMRFLSSALNFVDTNINGFGNYNSLS